MAGTCVLSWLYLGALAMVATMPLATAFSVCPMNRTVVLRPGDVDNAYKARTQYVLISTTTQNTTYFVDVEGCETNWTSVFESRPSGHNVTEYMKDSDGRVWYEISYHTLEADHRWIMVAIGYNSDQYNLDGRIITCTADQVSFTFSNDTQVGQYCQPSSDPPLGRGLSIFGYVMVAMVVMLVVVVVERVLFFKCLADDTPTAPDVATSAGATPPLDSVKVNAASDVPQAGPTAPPEDNVRAEGRGWMSPFHRFAASRNSLLPLIEDS